ncbi:hypothetical protein [Elizabethkingia meningoseptica]|uniref:hypothetical protein n=1 Tax=Elizabethkingia meningoseptica TaxID=238 RepID=UPI0023B108CE|nr:hypothetical protein [Elizabethkingia meningoseptica]MDE5527345.1 hypothetical protein [Elizabethkingia meningoseptica]
MKKLLNKLIIIEFEDKEPQKGILINYSKDWFLIKYNPVDFILDGYTAIKNYKVKNIKINDDTEFVEKAMKLKGISVDKKVQKLSLQNFDSIVENINKNFGIFSLAKKKDYAIYPGKLKKLTDKKIILTWIDLNANWKKNREFTKDKVRTIEFDSDYLVSLKLLSENK